MPDGVDSVSTGFETDSHWSNDYDTITSNADVHAYAKKFADPGALAKSGYGLERKLGSSYRLPDDLKTLNEEQRADVMTKLRGLKNLPKTADGYEIKLADGTERNEPFENAFKALAFEKGYSQDDVQSLTDFYVNAMNGAVEAENQRAEAASAKAETEYRMKCGVGYDQKMKEIDMARQQFATKLHLTYKDGEKTCSKLDDALNMKDVNGRCLGNNPAMLEVLNYCYDNLFKEAEPVRGDGTGPVIASDAVMSDAFYDNPTPSGE